MADYKVPAGDFAGTLISELLGGSSTKGEKYIRDAADEALKLSGVAEDISDSTLDLLAPTLWRLVCGKVSGAISGMEVQLEDRS